MLSGGRRRLKLEVNERLNIRTLHLHDDKYDDRDGNGRKHDTPFFQQAHTAALPGVGNPVRKEGEGHQQENISISHEDIGKNGRVELREHLPEHDPHPLEVLAAEEKPCKAEDVERDEHGDETAYAGGMIMSVVSHDGLRPELVQTNQRTVQHSPHDEVERCAVPQATGRHGHHLVEIHVQRPFPVSSECDVDVIADPCRERDMPATPEVGHGIGGERRIEVHRDLESEQQGDTDRHVRIAREITVDLYAVAVKAEEHLPAGEERRVVEDAVDEVLGNIVGDDRLLKETDEDEEHALCEHLTADMKGLADLRPEVSRTGDRTCQEGREETDIESIVEERFHRFYLLPVDIHDIGNGLEGIETDADRQEDVPRLEVAPDHLCDHPCKEIGVLEVAQQTEVNEQTGCQPQTRMFPFGDFPCKAEVAYRDDKQQQEVETAAFVEEIIGEKRHEEQSCIHLPAQAAIARDKDQEDEEERT